MSFPLQAPATVLPSSHIVQFYKDDEFLCEAAGSFLASGLRDGAAALVLATPAHREGFAHQLQRGGIDVSHVQSRGQLVTLDACEMVSRLVDGETLDPDRFASVIGRAVERAGAEWPGAPVCAFGELVDLLWRDGRRLAAIRLEQLWERLVRTRGVSLMCAYDMRNFRDVADSELFSSVCDCHDAVVPTESFIRLPRADRDREVSELQQRAEALEREVERRAELELALRTALDSADAQDRIKDQFLAVVSHELRTPLHAILGWSAILQARPTGDVARAAATIERNAKAQLRIIEDVLDLSQVFSGKLRLDIQPVDLARVLRDALEVAAPAAAGKAITVEATLDAEPCPFLGDGTRLQQVFWHILANAIKFTREGGRVDVGLARSASAVEVTFRDTGCGIRADFLPFVFDRFRQADSSTTRSAGGMGIGLAMVRHLTEMHGGLVTASSDGEDQGTTLRVTLPNRESELLGRRDP